MDPAIGKILGMAMAYAVSSLGLLLAYYNYRKRIVKAEQIFTPTAKVILGLVAGIAFLAIILGAAVLSPGEASAWAKIVTHLPGMIIPALIFGMSYWVTWVLYKHFTKTLGAGSPPEKP